jgi:enoyl-[acyl-carrier protein] reductase II
MEFINNRICKLFNIQVPILQAGMVWVSGSKLASAAANTGCLGVLGAGSMKPSVLQEHLEKVKLLTNRSIAVNLPLLYDGVGQQIDICLKAGIKHFITSAGNPKIFTSVLKSQGATVTHVVSTPTFALKSQDAGVDAVVVEGFEAGGHNGRDELTTFVLLQLLYKKLNIPIIAAGGVGTGAAMAGCLVMGAEGVQMGTAFAATVESSAHVNFKNAMLNAGETGTFLRLKKQVPVRLLNNSFSKKIEDLELHGASKEQLEAALGKGRARKGMLEGDIEEGELEVGQIVASLKALCTCQELVDRILAEFETALKSI